MRPIRPYSSHGDGEPNLALAGSAGSNVVIEAGTRIFDMPNVFFGSNVYIGHDAHLVGYHNGRLAIGDNCWIGPRCYFHGAGTIEIGDRVGIGAQVKILTSVHAEEGRDVSILYSDLSMSPVVIEDDCDIGVGATILPGVRIGRGAMIGAGSVVTADIPPYAVVAGVPGRVLRMRPE